MTTLYSFLLYAGYVLTTCTQELQCSNEPEDNPEIHRLHHLLQLKDEQIGFLIDKLEERQSVTEVNYLQSTYSVFVSL